MTHWVYIYEDESSNLTIGITATMNMVTSKLKLKELIVYLRPFELPFDALAQKHLLGDISKESLLYWIEKHKEATKKWLNVMGGR